MRRSVVRNADAVHRIVRARCRTFERTEEGIIRNSRRGSRRARLLARRLGGGRTQTEARVDLLLLAFRFVSRTKIHPHSGSLVRFRSRHFHLVGAAHRWIRSSRLHLVRVTQRLLLLLLSTKHQSRALRTASQPHRHPAAARPTPMPTPVRSPPLIEATPPSIADEILGDIQQTQRNITAAAAKSNPVRAGSIDVAAFCATNRQPSERRSFLHQQANTERGFSCRPIQRRRYIAPHTPQSTATRRIQEKSLPHQSRDSFPPSPPRIESLWQDMQ